MCNAVLGVNGSSRASDRAVDSLALAACGLVAWAKAIAARPSTRDYASSAIRQIERSEPDEFHAKQSKNTCDHLLIANDASRDRALKLLN